MDFGYDARTEELRDRLTAFMADRVYPAEPVFAAQVAEARAAGRRWERPPVMAELKAEARRRGLWNLFLARGPQAGNLRGAAPGLTNLQYAPLAETTSRRPS